MDVIIVPLLQLLRTAIDLYVIVVIAAVVLSWLTAFNVVNHSNRFVYLVGDFIYRVTEPALRPIRNFLPNLGGIDISPVVLILLLYAVQEVLTRLLLRFV